MGTFNRFALKARHTFKRLHFQATAMKLVENLFCTSSLIGLALAGRKDCTASEPWGRKVTLTHQDGDQYCRVGSASRGCFDAADIWYESLAKDAGKWACAAG